MSTKELTKVAAKQSKLDPDGLRYALKNGNVLVWLTCLVMGLGNFAVGQIVKGLIFLAIEVAFVAYMIAPTGGVNWLGLMPSLGDRVTEEVWNEDLGVYEYAIGDNSQQILLYATATLVAIGVFIVIWRSAVRSAYKSYALKKAGKKVPTFVDDIKSLFDENIHKMLMFLPFSMLMIFTVVPLVYMIDRKSVV